MVETDVCMETDTSKLQLLKRAYRELRREYREREDEVEAERSEYQRERRQLVTRVEELERELAEMKESVRAQGRAAASRLEELERQGAEPLRTPAAHPAPNNASMSSYERGMVWADKVMNVKGTLSSALSSTVESVSTLAMPASVQLQLQRQQVCRRPVRCIPCAHTLALFSPGYTALVCRTSLRPRLRCSNHSGSTSRKWRRCSLAPMAPSRPRSLVGSNSAV